jgi:hypothetical protein
MNLSRLSPIDYFPALLMGVTLFAPAVAAQSPNHLNVKPIAQSPDEAGSAAIARKAAAVIELLAGGKYQQVRESVSPQLAEKWSSEQIEQIWDNLMQATGSLKKQLAVEVVNTINADLVIVGAQFEKTTAKFIVTFDKNQNIVGIDFPKIDTIDRIAENFVNYLAANDYPRARGYLHPFLKTEIFPQQIQGKWEALIKDHGRVERIVETEIRSGSTIDGVDVVVVTIKFENVVDEIFIIFDEERRIVAVDVPTIN